MHRLLVCLAGAALLTACGGTRRSVAAEWQAEAVWTAPAKLGGCATGELVSSAVGEEIVAVSITGEVHLLQRAAGTDLAAGWEHRVLARTTGELIQVAVGDADPTSPGNEVLAVGMKAGTEDDGGPGQAWLVTHVNDREPVLLPLLEDTALLHAGTIADVDPDSPGDEIVVAGFGLRVHVLAHDGAGFVHTVAGELPGPAKHAVGWRGGAAIACANGDLVLLTRAEEGWELETLASASTGLARLGPSAGELAVGRDDGVLWILDPTGEGREAYREGQKLRGAVRADLDPDRPGLEAAAAGYEGRIVVVAEDPERPGEWLSVEVWKEDQRFHHLTSGEVDPAGIGLELVGCGYSGNVVVVRRTKIVC